MGSIADNYRSKTSEMFSPIYGIAAPEIEDIAREHIEQIIFEEGLGEDIEIVDLALHGSRSRGLEHKESDIDIVVELDSDWSEDALFNLIAEEPLLIGGIPVDINPITAHKSGSLDDYLARAEDYLADSANR